MHSLQASSEKIAYLKTLLEYEPETGIFRWKVETNCHGGKIRVGDVAGTKGDDQGRYAKIGIDGRPYRAHIIAYWFMTGESVPENMDIDHTDRDKRNNRWHNLRLVDRSINNHNSGLHQNNRSGVKGVSWNSSRGVWFAVMSVGGKRVLGKNFPTFEEATKARLDAEEKYLGVRSFAPAAPNEYDRPVAVKTTRPWSDPDLRSEQSARLKAFLATPEGKVARQRQAKEVNNRPGAREKMSAILSNTIWITNGSSNTRVPKTKVLPDGWRLGRTKKGD
ncbi:MAG: HNH endonuclease signature motif containing protein [Gallionella sp.]|nr:HNH endonuclease signature motif containing protein [Gallionella sp.]MDD4958393.1 HNH endonuclease signature motif containing protein [Gallionella sp.]